MGLVSLARMAELARLAQLASLAPLAALVPFAAAALRVIWLVPPGCGGGGGCVGSIR